MTHRWILRAIFARPDFRRLLGTRLASQCADGVFQASLAGAVLFNPERQANPASIAAGFSVVLLPYSLVGPFAGVLLDRWSRQRVLVLASVLRCLLVGLVAIETSAGLGGVLFYGSALLVISGNRFFLSALSAAQPHVVEEPQLVTANATSTTCGSLATTAGAGIAIGLLGLLGSDNTAYALVATAAIPLYGAAAVIAGPFGRDQLGPDDVERERRETLAAVARGLAAGGRHVVERRPAFTALAAIGAHRFCYGISFVVILLLYRNYFTDEGFFQAGVTGLGQAVLATAAGGFLAAVVTPPATRRYGLSPWIAGCLALASVTQLAAGLPYSMQGLLPGAFVLGFAAQSAKICVDTTVQEEIEDEFRGRVFSLYDTLFNLAFVAACVFTAFTVPTTGKSYPMLLLVVTGYAVTALLYWRSTLSGKGVSPAGQVVAGANQAT